MASSSSHLSERSAPPKNDEAIAHCASSPSRNTALVLDTTRRVGSIIFRLIGSTDLCHFEAAGTGTRKVVFDARAWVTCLEAGSRISLGKKLGKDIQPSSERWQDIKTLACTLRGVRLVDRRPWMLKEPFLLNRLAWALGRAHMSSADHLRCGGKMAHIFVGHFSFPVEGRGLADGVGPRPLTRGDNTSRWMVTSLLRLGHIDPLPGTKNRRNKRGAANGAHRRAKRSGALRLRLAVQNGRALLSATQQDNPGADEIPSKRPLSIDIYSINPSMVLQSQGTVVTAGGPWRLVQGNVVVPTNLLDNDAWLQEVLRVGLRCVVCVQDATCIPECD